MELINNDFFSIPLDFLSVEKFRLFKTFGFEETPLIHGQDGRKDTWGLEIGD